MSTKNRRVAAYLPPEVDKAFIDFKIEHGLATQNSPNQNDSQALIQLLSEFLGVSQNVTHLVSHVSGNEWIAQLSDLREELVSQISELSSELLLLQTKVNGLEVFKKAQETLTTSQMVKRLGISSSTMTHWKKNKNPQELKAAIQEKDPEKAVWVYFADTKIFKRDSSSLGALQGELLSGGATNSDQINPLPEGSERSGEG